MIIKGVYAKKIKDSRNNNTIEVFVNGSKASAPSGKSTGKYESKPYFRSIEFCINFLNNWKGRTEINKFQDLNKIEKIIKNKLKIKSAKEFGGNSLFAFESAILKALAKEKKKELWQVINPKAGRMPVPVGNAVGGGLHSNNKNHPVFQEFLIIPQGKSIKDNYKIMKEIYSKIGRILKAKSVNDEGAWNTDLSIEEILEILSQFKRIKIGIDVAASSFYKKGLYNYENYLLSKQEQIDYINNLIKKYNLFYLEDLLQEEDFSGFGKINKKNLVVGDDLTATHIERIKKAVKIGAVNAIIVKPNQNGSLVDVAEIVKYCRKYRIKTIFSHRSGETMDSSLADYAFGFQADYIKCGIATKWRDVKLRRLIEIERKIKKV